MGAPNRLVIWGIAAVVGVIAHLPDTGAAPIIQVKARTRIKLEPILRSGSTIIIRGRLFDRAGDDPIKSARVWLYFDRFGRDRTRRTTQTDDTGRFDFRMYAPPGKHNLIVRFNGDAHHSPASVEIIGFDASKNPLSLTLQLPKEVAYPPKKLQARLTAMSGDTPVRLPIKVYVSEASNPAIKAPVHELPSITTDADGEATIILPASTLGKPGRKVVELKFAGDDSYDAAETRAELLLVSATSLTAKLKDSSISFESSAHVSGKLVDNTNEGVVLARIVLFGNGKRLGHAVTKHDGSYEIKVSAKRIGAGKTALEIRFVPSRSWRKASASKPLSIAIGEPRPVPVGYTLAAFGATALVLLTFVGLRAKPWRNWAWLAKLRHQEPEPEQPDESEKLPVQTGLQLARPSLVSTLRRANDNGVAGVVRDAITAKPLGGAVVEMIHTGDYAATATTTGDGSFAVEGLAHGHWRATVRCYGYCAERFPLGIPHRGELRGVRVDLLPVRERIFEMYRTVARPLLPDVKKWGIWTPRQIVDHVRRNQPRPALAALTNFVEETYFSQRTPGEDILERAGGLVRAAKIESGR